jgi:hypothetical protein
MDDLERIFAFAAQGDMGGERTVVSRFGTAVRRPAEMRRDTSLVQEVDEHALRPARRRLLEGEPWALPTVVEQLFRGKDLIAQRVTMRCFAVVIDDEVTSYTDLCLRGGDAQIEDVGTLRSTAVAATAPPSS